ncbi:MULTISPECIES: hypothetical protein [unclassified Nocardioides]|uniref:hypothetical protein n=1 Tax=unclassified Nocardioides TaxID=2615069 RepID=UPI0006F50761|nr:MULTISPECIES: hypothetical protein [unclassified Nocardioides]KRA37882.1 hypothetical protein ASD81_04145 [Nocardioides sp. Root614]KRA91842.1 hypothetical protein ASD84_04410 [Nocardioides sp. Root682]
MSEGNLPSTTKAAPLPDTGNLPSTKKTPVTKSASGASRVKEPQGSRVVQYGPDWMKHVLAGGELKAGNLLVN